MVAGIWIARRRSRKLREARNEAKEAEGLEKKNEERAEVKEERKAKILNFLEMRGKTNNDEVERMLNVSDASAENYLDELEKEGKIKQIGKTGQAVEYELNG